jgi:YidC/Oxa1 family membrane protein insertase
MDRNTVIGFVLLAVLFFGYFYYTRQGQLEAQTESQRVQDSLNRKRAQDSILRNQTAKIDTVVQAPKTNVGAFQQSAATEQLISLENEFVKIGFSTKGGQPKLVELKKYQTFDGKPLILQNGKFHNFSYPILSGPNQTTETSQLYFTPSAVTTDASGTQILSFTVGDSLGKAITHQYRLPKAQYMLDMSINFVGAENLITQRTLNLTWQAQAPQVEKDIEYEKLQSQIGYVEDDEYDFSVIGGSGDKLTFAEPVDWLSLKQQFFTSTLVAPKKIKNAELEYTVPDDSARIIAQATAHCRIDVPAGMNASIPLQLYYGPSDYRILKSYGNGMHNIVPLGSGIFAFVKYINRGFIMPVFDFLGDNIASFGLVIALLTIIIRLLISPLTYQSYLSGAKMKLLKPEIDELKKKYGDDKQAFGMEQMKLYRSAGVNPLGGCIPALLQIPIFFALYNFFNSNIRLRGESFWWAEDLSAYDSILNLPFDIPLYGGHISLFTILAVVTTLLISLYGMANMQDNSNPVMKYLPFIFPIILLGVFNNQPAALTWYYTVSNVITLIIQFIIQKYIINHEKLLAQLQENKKKPQKASKWQERINAMQEQQKKVQEMKAKVAKKK